MNNKKANAVFAGVNSENKVLIVFAAGNSINISIHLFSSFVVNSVDDFIAFCAFQVIIQPVPDISPGTIKDFIKISIFPGEFSAQSFLHGLRPATQKV